MPNVVRDVGRALDYHYDFVDKIAKGVTIKANNPMSLKQFIFGDENKGIPADEKLLERYNSEPEVKKLIDVALKIEGLTRQIGKGAAGVVISASKLIDYTPLYTVDAETPPQTQYEIADVEKAGLVKFDFLGLRNLTIIKDTIDLIHKTGKEDSDKEKEFFDIRKINIDDIEVYENIYGNGNTGGVFQFESKGISAVLQKAKPQNLKDIIAVNALYRPGPMDIIPEWLKSKSSPEEQRPYPHDSLRDVLKETYGFMIYQEQVMQCAQIIAGYTLGEADLLRRAMGKKKPEEMAKQRSIFIAGAAKNNISEHKANEIFDLIDKFAGYGFNKSHAAAYSLLSYQTAYLKHYYPEQFFAATLNSHVTTLDTDKIAIAFKDAEENNIKILGPDVNESKALFGIEGDRILRYGLAAIKGVGDKAASVIAQEREKNGPFNDFFDFMERVGRGHVNKRVLEALIKAGALDSLNENRAELFDNLKESLDYVKKYRDKQLENVSVLGSALFDDEDQPAVTKTKKKKAQKELIRPELKPAEKWTDLVQSINEKQAFGYFFSSNPYNSYYAKELDGLTIASKLSDVADLFYSEGINEVIVGALVEDINWWKSKKGAFVTINDGLISTDIRMFESTLNENKEWLKKDAFILLRLKVEKNEKEDNYEDVMLQSFDGNLENLPKEKEGIDTLMFSTQQAFSFEKTKELTMNKLFVGADGTDESIENFNKICEEFKSENGTEVILCVPDEKGRRVKKVNSLRIQYNEKLFNELKNNFGDEWVKATFKKDINLIDFPKLKNKNNNKQFKKRSSFSI